MKPDEFEQKLQRQPLRQVPAGWREEILTAAGRASRVEGRVRERLCPSSFVSRLSAILWPHPAAWAGLAAVWAVILALNFSARDKAPTVATKSTPLSPDVMVELRQQQRMLAELIGARDTRDADHAKLLVPPRSGRAEFLAV